MSTSLAWSVFYGPPAEDRTPTSLSVRVALFSVPACTALALILRLGAIVQLAFLPLSVVCGFVLLRASPIQYVRYTLWVWCMTPLVRRLADYQAGHQQRSMVLLAPFCVTLICLLPLMQQVRHLFRRDTLPFTLTMLGVFYGVAVGLLKVPAATVAQTTLQWIAPLLFGLYCYTAEDQMGTLAKTVKRSLILIGLVVSIYGIFQFFDPLAWDKFWLTNVTAGLLTNSFGLPEPMKVRVFSTMNSAGVLAPFLSCALLMLFGESKWLVLGAGTLTAACLLLTQARTEWFGVLVAGTFVLAKSSPGIRLRAVLGIIACTLLVPLIPGAGEPLQILFLRLGSFSDIGHDESAGMRLQGLQDAATMISDDPFGQGMGYLDSDLFLRSQIAARHQVAAHDIGLLELGIELGYIGSFLYGAALVLVVRTVYVASRTADAATVSLIAVCIASACYVAITNPVIQFNGVLLWGAAGLILGRRRFSERVTEPTEEPLFARPLLRSAELFHGRSREYSEDACESPSIQVWPPGSERKVVEDAAWGLARFGGWLAKRTGQRQPQRKPQTQSWICPGRPNPNDRMQHSRTRLKPMGGQVADQR